MKAIVVAALLALSFTTGFTCSKNQPAETSTSTTSTTTTQDQMAAPVATPADGTMATPADGAAPTPAVEASPAAAATPETK
jgi:hypothetical protein